MHSVIEVGVVGDFESGAASATSVLQRHAISDVLTSAPVTFFLDVPFPFAEVQKADSGSGLLWGLGFRA